MRGLQVCGVVPSNKWAPGMRGPRYERSQGRGVPRYVGSAGIGGPPVRRFEETNNKAAGKKAKRPERRRDVTFPKTMPQAAGKSEWNEYFYSLER